MKTKIMSKIGAMTLAAALTFSAVPTFASENGKFEISLTDATVSSNALRGEAKVKLGIRGAVGTATIIQLALELDGNLTYRSLKPLKVANDPDNGCAVISTVNQNTLHLAIIVPKGISLKDNEDLFILTFVGNPDDRLTLRVDHDESTYCTVNQTEMTLDHADPITLTAANKENIGKAAKIQLSMDRMRDFTGVDDPQINVKIIGETSDVQGEVISIDLNNTPITDGGHRDSATTIPTFITEANVADGNTYTVEITAPGYVSYQKKGVSFQNTLKLTNTDLIPGDVNHDRVVNLTDKTMTQTLIKNQEYSTAADFNRDGLVDTDDLAVFAHIQDAPTDTPDTPSNGGNNGNNNGGATGGGGGGSLGGGSVSGGTASGGSLGGGSVSEVPPTQSRETFGDLADYAWAKEAIYTLKDKGIISGISETEFAPSEKIKRGDFILILTRMLGITDAFTENFVDVMPDTYYYQAIGSAKAAKIAAGDGDRFMPEDSITRQDLITLAYRAFLNKGYITQTDDMTVLNSFSDCGEIADYAKDAMAAMVKAGIIQGADGKVNPKDYATRAEVAVMCARLVVLLNTNG